MWRYRELLPVRGEPVSLGEGETPLLFLERLSERWGAEVWAKDDSPLPGATFKARGAAAGLSRAVELGAERLVMPSAGNAGGAWSLYAARAGLPITVTMAKTAPVMNQREVSLAGGELVLVDGTIADAAARAKEIAAETGAFHAATFSEPYRIDGKKTTWLETYDRLGDDTSMRLPGSIVLPVGGGVGLIAARKAAEEVRSLGWTEDAVPMLIAAQSDGAAPIVRAFDANETEVEPWNDDVRLTAAAGIRVPAPSEGDLVLEDVRATGGTAAAASEEDLMEALTEVASTEGLFCCPEGAVAFAVARRLIRDGGLPEPVVVYNTGAGAKYAAVI